MLTNPGCYHGVVLCLYNFIDFIAIHSNFSWTILSRGERRNKVNHIKSTIPKAIGTRGGHSPGSLPH